MNCAFNKRYNPARAPKFKIKNNADITTFDLVIIRTEVTAAIPAKKIKSIISKVIYLNGRWLMVDGRCF